MIKSGFTPPKFDQATVDHYVAKGKRERSQAIAAFFRSLFSGQSQRKAQVQRKSGTRMTTA